MTQLQIGYEGLTRIGVKELKNSEERLRTFFSRELESCSLFLIPVNLSDPFSVSTIESFVKALSSSLTFLKGETGIFNILPASQGLQNFRLNYLVFENIEPAHVKQMLLARLSEMSGVNHRSLRYNRYGLFIPRTGKIVCFSFAHSGSMYYRYRLAEFKLKTLPGGLNCYLRSLLIYCPNEYFFSGSRASGFILNMQVSMNHSTSHEISSLVVQALRVGKFKSGHENVEKYLLESDPDTIACEVPVWYENPEQSRLCIEGVLTGHIDVLRFENNGRIGIWDYKPRARYEKKAHMQVYLYALMLSQRTGIPLSNFLCGYFDSTDAYFFNAEDATL